MRIKKKKFKHSKIKHKNIQLYKNMIIFIGIGILYKAILVVVT